MPEARYRNDLPQLGGDLFLTDAGLETDLIFNRGIELREFAAHTILGDRTGREALETYFRDFLGLARDTGAGFILDSQTWKAHPHWSADLGEGEAELAEANRQSIRLISGLRREFAANAGPIVLNAVIGPCGDAYRPEDMISVADAEAYHATQIGWLAETEVDMVSALTFTQSGEAAGFVLAAKAAGLPAVVSFTVETDGRLPSGEAMADAIAHVDRTAAGGPAYYMLNCAHPEHFIDRLEDAAWSRRIRGLRCNASNLSHAELDACETLDDGDPHDFARQCVAIRDRLPWLNIFGGCCGSDLRHVAGVAHALAA